MFLKNIRMYPKDQLFCDKRKFKQLNMIHTDKEEIISIETLLIYTLWYIFSNDFDTQSDFGKKASQKSRLR